LYWLHHAGISRQIHAVHEPAAGISAIVERGVNLRPGHSRLAAFHAGFAEQGTGVEDSSEGVTF
jgi:hypothetical protein